jgi:hypothetical protein
MPGGAFLLFVLAGASFGRFQLQRVVLEKAPSAVLGGLPKLILPAIALLAIQQLRHRHFEPTQLLLFSNFLGAQIGGYWFIEVWVQTYLGLFLLLSIPPVARLVATRPVHAALGMLSLGVVLRLVVPEVWNTDHLYNRLPHISFWSFALGWCIALVGPSKRWLVTGLILMLGPTLSYGLGPKLWVTLGALCLLWLPPLRLPHPLVAGLAWISSASLYIYIAQAYFFTIAERLLSSLFPFSGWLLAIVGGGLLRMGADYGWSLLRSWLPGARPALARG